MRPDSLLVNTSRSGLVESGALESALDVTREEYDRQSAGIYDRVFA